MQKNLEKEGYDLAAFIREIQKIKRKNTVFFNKQSVLVILEKSAVRLSEWMEMRAEEMRELKADQMSSSSTGKRFERSRGSMSSKRSSNKGSR